MVLHKEVSEELSFHRSSALIFEPKFRELYCPCCHPSSEFLKDLLDGVIGANDYFKTFEIMSQSSCDEH